MSKTNIRLVFFLIALIVVVKMYDRDRNEAPRSESRENRADRQLAEQLTPSGPVEQKEGLAAAILIDVSGSMDESVAGVDGKKEKKIA